MPAPTASGENAELTPRVSVVIPVRNARADLAECLSSLRRQTTLPAEVILVDDASSDGSGAVAAAAGATIIRLDRQAGPAHARNLGAARASGDLLFFVDADIALHPEAITRAARCFQNQPGLAAVIGAYDHSPASPRFLSQFKNLQHCFVHRTGRREAGTFWSGIGCIRREVFLAAGGFDAERYPRPSIEDIELGARLRQQGCRILLEPEIQGTHRKVWTLPRLLLTDLRDRAIPWTVLVLGQGRMPDDLNLGWAQRASVILAWLYTICFLYTAWTQRLEGLLPWAASLFALFTAWWLDLAAHRSAAALLPIALGLLGMGRTYSEAMHFASAPLAAQLIAILGAYLRAAPVAPRHPAWGVLAGAAALLPLFHQPASLPFAVALAAGLGLLALNLPFYRFLAARRGLLFALAALPAHGIYFLYSGAGFGLGLLQFFWRRVRHPKQHLEDGNPIRPKSDPQP